MKTKFQLFPDYLLLAIGLIIQLIELIPVLILSLGIIIGNVIFQSLAKINRVKFKKELKRSIVS